MIKTERQFVNARQAIRELEEALKKQIAESIPPGVDPRLSEASLAGQRRVIARLRAEIDEYEALKAGDTSIIHARSLSELPRALIQTRIVRKLTQKALAEKLGVKEQQIQRWEQRDYENVGFECLLNVAEALEFDAHVVVRAPHQGRSSELAVHDSGRLLQILQKATTFNQTMITHYSYVGSDWHKKLRIARDSGRPPSELLRHFKTLFAFLDKEFEAAVAHNATFLRASFDDRGGPSPRICLKSNMISDRGNRILPLFRDTAVTYDSSVDVSGNTGFAEIARTGNFFVEHDIPAAALHGNYINPRLNTKAIRKRFPKPTPAALDELNRDWKSFWYDSGREKNEAAFYKSTLIMPLKLWDSDISTEFRAFLEKFQISSRIYGYLCLDHTSARYFKPDVDLNTSKIFSDVLCTMLLLRMKWTTYSSNTKAVSEIKDVADWLRTQNDKVPTLQVDKLPPSESPVPTIQSKGVPKLVEADLRRSLADA